MKISYIINAIFIIAMSIVWTFNEFFFSESMTFEANMFQSIIIIIAAALGAIFLIHVALLYKISTSIGKVWLLLGLGIMGWCIGDIIYAYYENYTEVAPFPSIADLFYLLAYIPLSWGLILQMRLLQIKLPLGEKIIIAIIFIIVCIIVAVFVIVIPIQEEYPIPEDELIGYLVSALYPIVDLILLLCVIIVFAKFRKGKIHVAWILLLMGILMTLIADILFNWVESIVEETATFELYDLLFLIGYVFIYIGALAVINIMTKTFEAS